MTSIVNEFKIAKVPARVILAIMLGFTILLAMLPAQWELIKVMGLMAQMFCAGVWLTQEMHIWEAVTPSNPEAPGPSSTGLRRITLQGKFHLAKVPARVLVATGIAGLLIQGYMPAQWFQIRVFGGVLQMLCLGMLAAQHMAIWEPLSHNVKPADSFKP